MQINPRILHLYNLMVMFILSVQNMFNFCLKNEKIIYSYKLSQRTNLESLEILIGSAIKTYRCRYFDDLTYLR